MKSLRVAQNDEERTEIEKLGQDYLKFQLAGKKLQAMLTSEKMELIQPGSTGKFFDQWRKLSQ